MSTRPDREVRNLIGQRIKARRESLRMGQKQLADLLDCPIMVVNYTERGLSGMRIERLPAVARALNVRGDYLLGLIDEPLPLTQE